MIHTSERKPKYTKIKQIVLEQRIVAAWCSETPINIPHGELQYLILLPRKHYEKVRTANALFSLA